MDRIIFNPAQPRAVRALSAALVSLATLGSVHAQTQALPQSCSQTTPLFLVPNFAAAASSGAKAACWQTRVQPHSSRATLCCPQNVQKTNAVTPHA